MFATPWRSFYVLTVFVWCDGFTYIFVSFAREKKKKITFLSSRFNESCGAPYRMNTSGAASGVMKDPPQVANERPGAVRPLNSDNPNDAAFLLVSIIGV